MSRLFFLKFFIFFILFGIPIVYANTQENSNENPAVYSEDKSSFSITSSQQEFTIKLKSNPTTGYSWFLRDYEHDLIEPISQKFEPPTDMKLAGAPGYELWRFKVKAKGFIVPEQTLIRFVYARPWESGDQARQSVFQIYTIPEKLTSHS